MPEIPQATYGNFLLRQNHCTVLPPQTYRGDICGGDSFEGIFCRLRNPCQRDRDRLTLCSGFLGVSYLVSGLHTNLIETALVRENRNVSVVTCASC